MNKTILRCIVAVLAMGVCVPVAVAERHVIHGQQESTIFYPGGYVAYRNPDTQMYYESEPMDWDFDLGFDLNGASFATIAIFDTGASGSGLVSRAVVEALGLPMSGETFDDIGIGGIETFDVVAELEIMLAFHNNDIFTSPTKAEFSSFGLHKFKARQQDSDLIGPIEIVGMGVLNGRVMHVEPNVVGELTFSPFIAYSKTTMLSEAPALPAGAFRVPLTLVNFIEEDDPPVTFSDNPMVDNVHIKLNALTEPTNAGQWLLDTGAAVSIVGRSLAEQIGIDLANDVPVTSVPVAGVGDDEIRELLGYQVSELILPLIGGDELVFTNVILFVPEEGDLPADLPGILGGNLWGPSLANADLGTLRDSPFQYYWVDLINNEMVFVLIPEPAGGVMLVIVAMTVGRRHRRRYPSGTPN